MATTRFGDQAVKAIPVATDFVVGTDAATGEDIRISMAAVGEAMKVILAPYLLTTEEREQLEEGPPVIAVQYKYYRGTTAPSVDANNANPGADWVENPGTGTGAVWRIGATFSNGVFVPPWSVAVKITGEDGIDGQPGDDGTPGNQYFFQDEEPSSEGRLVGDVWWDTGDNNKQHRWDGSAWKPSFAPMLTVDEAGRVTGLVRAGESAQDFVLLADKFQIWNGTSAEVPFEIVAGTVYIKKAAIREVAASAIIGDTITGQEIILHGTGSVLRSSDYVAGVSGWMVNGERAEFPALTVRSSQIEANAVTRTYGSAFPNTGLLAAGAWHEIAGLDVTMDAGNSAVIGVSFGYETTLIAPFPTDAEIRLLRADGSQVQLTSWTAQGGNTELISYTFYDATPTTRYKVELKSTGGTGGARSLNMNVVIYRK